MSVIIIIAFVRFLNTVFKNNVISIATLSNAYVIQLKTYL